MTSEKTGMVDGRPFECRQCGACCRWEGKVFLVPEDVTRLAVHLSIPIADFLRKYTETYGSSRVLRDDPSGACMLMEGDKCSVHGYQPAQCSKFPMKFDPRCPGFGQGGEGPMDYREAVDKMNDRLSQMSKWDEAVAAQLYLDLSGGASRSSVASKGITNGVDPYAGLRSIKVASVDDLFAFHRTGEKHLIHKCTRDLWAIESDKDGVRITRLFDDNGQPIKG